MKLNNIDFVYRPAAKTDISVTLRNAGFTPPSEDKRYQEKWNRYRNAAAINERKAK